jgi:zinc resistance-associated protein
LTKHFGATIMAAVVIVGLGLLSSQAEAQQGGPDGRQGPPRERPRISDEDRAAFLDARLASLRAGLRLTADQEKVWPALEAAARDRARIQSELQKKEVEAGPPANLIEGLRRRGEGDLARGAADTRLADAAQPLWASLSEEQRRRLPILARGIINGGWSEQERGGGPRPQPDPRDPQRAHQGHRSAGEESSGREPAPPR